MAQTQSTRNTTLDAQTLARILSVYSAEHNMLLVPQLGVPNASGGIDVFAVLLKMTNIYPVQFELIGIEPVANPVHSLSGLFSPQDQIMFVPVMVADLGGNTPVVPIYEVALKLSSLSPVLLTEYLPVQTTQPTSNQSSAVMSDPAMYNMMSQFSRMSHDTSMSILSNMDGTSCYGYDYQCN